MPSYAIYTSLHDYLSKSIKKYFPSMKKLTDAERIGFYLTNNDELQYSVPHILANEYIHSKNGNYTIFPESRAVLDNLLSAKFDMTSIEGFRTPYGTFSLAIPSGYIVEGVIMPPLLASWVDAAEYGDTFFKPFYKDYLKSGFEFTDRFNSDKLLTICYPDPYNKGVSARSSFYSDEIKLALKCSNPKEFEKAVHSFFSHEKSGLEQLTETDYKIQFYALRLISAISVYNLATEGKKLREGYPGTQIPSIIGKFDKKNLHAVTLSDTLRKVKSNDQDVSPHYRSWFFRQLRAERYYKGEYKDFAPGSRYAFVSETTVNKKVTPYTQEFGM